MKYELIKKKVGFQIHKEGENMTLQQVVDALNEVDSLPEKAVMKPKEGGL